MNTSESPVYREAQYFRHVWWVMLIVMAAAALMWWGFIQQILFRLPWGTNPAPDYMMWLLWLLVGIGLPLLFWVMGLVVEVHSDELQIRYMPLYQRSVQWADISSIAIQTYDPIRQYGGWGIRGIGDRRAYNIRGNRGVELILKDGHRILIGSQKPEDLAVAIESQLSI